MPTVKLPDTLLFLSISGEIALPSKYGVAYYPNFCEQSKVKEFKISSHYYNDNLVYPQMRVRYWRLAANDLLNSTYPQEKANHWEIKCLQGEYEHFGVFWFRYGTPFDKELINGICFYYNDIPQEKVKELLDFLQQKYGGNALFRQSRVFLQGSKEFNDKNEIANLANEISSKFNGPIEITLEFEKVTSEEQEQNTFNFPAGKELPIAGSE